MKMSELKPGDLFQIINERTGKPFTRVWKVIGIKPLSSLPNSQIGAVIEITGEPDNKGLTGFRPDYKVTDVILLMPTLF